MNNTIELEDVCSQIESKFPISGEFALSKINLKSINCINYQGIDFKVNSSAMFELFQLLKMGTGMVNEFSKVNWELNQKTFDILKTLISKKTNLSTVNVYINENTKEIIKFTKRNLDKTLIYPSRLVNILRKINKTSNLEISSSYLYHDCFKSQIDLVFKDSEFKVGNSEIETFKFGLSVNYTGTQISISPYNERLICTNGMITRDSHSTFIYRNNMKDDDILKFYENISRLAKENYAKTILNENIEYAKKMDISISDIKMLNSKIRNNVPTPVSENEKHILNNLLPNYELIKLDILRSKNIDIDNPDYASALPFIQSGHNLWDVINNITDFASHSNNSLNKLLTPANRRILQETAGSLLINSKKTYNNFKILKSLN
jgi:hypothetical protein